MFYMYFFKHPKKLAWLGVVCLLIPITATILNKNTPLAWDPSLLVSVGVWVGGTILVWIMSWIKKRSNKTVEEV